MMQRMLLRCLELGVAAGPRACGELCRALSAPRRRASESGESRLWAHRSDLSSARQVEDHREVTRFIIDGRIGDRQVGSAVAVEIGDCDSHRDASDRIIGR
jgi:hypothetical protein